VRGIVAVLGATLILAGGSGEAGAATLRAEYRFHGSLASEVPGAPELANIGRGNRFAIERIDGLGRHQVLRFPEGNGLSLSRPGLVDPANNSVMMVFRLAETHGYRRILDFAGGTSDTGLYNLDGRLALYGGRDGSDASAGAVLTNSYTQVTLTNAAAPGDAEQVTAYVNGDQVAAAKISKGFDLSSGEMRFFRDNRVRPFPGEESSGAISCLLVFDGTLTADEVKRVGSDPTLCPAPRPTPGRAQASVTGRPAALMSGGSVSVDTGLTVSCPPGTRPCAASGSVDTAQRRERGTAPASRHLGTTRFSVPAGESRKVQVRLSAGGARALRDAGSLRVRVSAQIKPAEGKIKRAQQTGTIAAPRPPAFRPGTYTGTTSQGLPIVLSVRGTAVRSVLFRWRQRCDDGKTHTNATVLEGRSRVRHGRFLLKGRLNSGGSARVSGELRGTNASGTLFRRGPSASGARCAVEEIKWSARATSVESGTSR
jgi:hypothetical protein